MSSGRRIEVRGTVQGVGFRPWVYRLAHETGIVGRVSNDARGVTIEAFGDDAELEDFIARLRSQAPPPAQVCDLHAEPIPDEPVDDFVIVASQKDGQRALSIPPDLATCADCAREVLDPADRRYRYAFTNCTHCGPRFTIATDVPYDRAATTMAPFEMCARCRREYDSVGNRRFHAQPNACPDCGPHLELWSPLGLPLQVLDPLVAAAARIVAGGIVAVKGLGGFHLACDANRPAAIAALRARKRRDHKPFAVMVRDLATARRLACITEEDAALLCSPERPIVITPRCPTAPIAAAVAPDNDLLGLFLPYTPLHHLLLAAADRPLVMTSANVADEPICADNEEAVRRLGNIADALLVHDRVIENRCDDSVVRLIASQPTLLRRSRGFVPRPVRLRTRLSSPVLACGGQLKNTFCLAADDSAYLGPHIGDLDNLASLEFFEGAIAKLEHLLDFHPEVIAHDMHPGYRSTRYARSRPEPIKIAVQHHHAHVASAMAEHGLTGPVLGLAFDGTGHGTDGTAWGGEFLLATFEGFERLATFRPIKLAGGDLATRDAWRIALALLVDTFEDAPPLAALPLFEQIDPRSLEVVRQMLATDLNCPRARGVGRYFDGACALATARTRARFEGQLAMAWGELAARDELGCYPYAIDRSPAVPEIDLRPLVRTMVADVISGVSPSAISARFHNTLVVASVEVVRMVMPAADQVPIVLTGGVFQNPRLVDDLARRLAGDYHVLVHGEVPPGDGGLALGQALVADAVAQRRS